MSSGRVPNLDADSSDDEAVRASGCHLADSSDDEAAPASSRHRNDSSSDSSVGRPDDMDKTDISGAAGRQTLALNADSSDDETPDTIQG